MNYFEIIYAFFATFFFSIIFNLKGKKIFFSSLSGAITWYTYLLFFYTGHTKTASFFAASIAVALYSEIVAKIIKTTVTTLLIPGLIPLVPGSGIYYTMSNLVELNYSKSAAYGLETIFLTVAISLGIFLVSTFSQIIHKAIKYARVVAKYREHKKYRNKHW